jgi:hypothetical protein
VQRGGSFSPPVILSEAKNLVVTAEILRFAQNDKLLRYFRRAALVSQWVNESMEFQTLTH